MIPTATVRPISRTANRPISGKSVYFSTHNFLIGCNSTTADSFLLRNFGLSSITAPVFWSNFLDKLMNFAATCAVCAWITGVYH